MAIAQKQSSSLSDGVRTNSTVAAPTGTTTGDVVVVAMTAGLGSLTPVTITPPAGWTTLANVVYDDTNPAWSVRLVLFARPYDGAASWTFQHASASSQVSCTSFSGVDLTLIADVVAAITTADTTSIVAPAITTATAGARGIIARGSWDGNAISSPSGWTEIFDQPVLWVGSREYATAGPTSTVTVPAGNGGAYPTAVIHAALRPAGASTPEPITGSLNATAPAVTAAAPQLAMSGTAAPPKTSTADSVFEIAAPLVTVGEPALDAHGTVDPPAYDGTLEAHGPGVTVAGPVLALAGTVAPPAYSGTLETSSPGVTVAAPTVTMSGTVAPPTYAGTLTATAPGVTVGAPGLSVSGTVAEPAPGVSGALVASAPAVVAGAPSLALVGAVSESGEAPVERPVTAVVVVETYTQWKRLQRERAVVPGESAEILYDTERGIKYVTPAVAFGY